MADAALSTESVSRSYGEGRAAVHAVREVDLALQPGERLLIMGPSGSGKTTLLSMIGGLLTPTGGRVTLGGEDVYSKSVEERARVRLERIGFIFQSFNLLSALSARENVEVPIRLTGRSPKEARRRAAQLLVGLGMQDRLSHRPRDLSGGEKQRVAIARALAMEPDVILADEPTANLDSRTGRQVAEILGNLGREQGKAVLIVSHDHRLLDVASRVAWLEDGQLADRLPDAMRAEVSERS